MNISTNLYNTFEQDLLRFFLSILLLFNMAGCGTTKNHKQTSAPETTRSPLLHEDTGAALVLTTLIAPLLVLTYPVQVLSNWKIKNWQTKIALLKIGTSQDEISKTFGRPNFTQKINGEREIWHYGMISYPHSISFTSKLRVVFEQKVVTKFEENTISNFQYY